MHKARSCFIHVPKAGGSAVIATLQSALGPEQVIHANESRYQHLPLPALLEQYPLVAGHFTFAQIPDALFDGTFFFTFLRDPVDRVLSHYYYYRERPARDDYDRRVARTQTLDLAAFVDDLPERPSPWSNWQTYVFSGAHHAEQPAEELLPAALRNLDLLDFVGVHDEFDDGLWSLGQLRGWTVGHTAPRVNVTAGRPHPNNIDGRVLERLRALNACDAVLVGRARELWQARKSWPRPAARPMTPPADGAAERTTRAEHGTREIVISDVAVRPEGDRAFIDIRGMSHVAADDVTIGIRITDALGAELYGVNTLMLGLAVSLQQGQPFEVTFALDMTLAAGRYYLTAAVHASDDHLHRCYHWIDNALAIDWQAAGAQTFTGLVDLRAGATLSLGQPAAVARRS